jgi:tetratricopeptide (TPR) repeat protein
MSLLRPVRVQLEPLLSATRTRRQLVWTVLLVLIALGGAGLATAADREPTDAARPELTWRAEQLAQPWIESMAAQLHAVEEEVGNLSAAGRDALVRLPTLEQAAIEQAVADGDGTSRRLDDLVASLDDLRDRQLEVVDDSRLSQASRELLGSIDEAVAAAAILPFAWAGLAVDARRVSQLLDALDRHDGLVFRATTAARQERYEQAVELLDQAAVPLAEAGALRNELAEYADVATLDELLARYADYDRALTALYEEILRSGTQDSPQVQALLAEVERAQSALPPNQDALRVVVAEAAGPSVADGLVAIETARGVVNDALARLP